MDFSKKYDRRSYISFFQNELLKGSFTPEIEEGVEDSLRNDLKLITSITRLGEADDLEGLRVYEISYKGARDPRVTLTKEIFRLMSWIGCNKILCVLKSEESNVFRLSLITVDADIKNGKLEKIRSNPRRYSFIVGPGAKVRTVEQMLNRGTVKNFEDLSARFSIEVVNKEFYAKIAELFTELVGGKRKVSNKEQTFNPKLNLPDNSSHQKMQEFGVRLIGRIVFCWFLKKKKSEQGKPVISDELLSSESVRNNKNYYHSILEKLFFETLNTSQEKRNASVQSAAFKDVPFLNGGLFDPHKDDHYTLRYKLESAKSPYESDFKDKGLLVAEAGMSVKYISDDWFTTPEGAGIFDVLELYNFTIDENTSNDVDLSIDPEMLGRIFENLLAEINPETGETARKSSGSFYTPRPIVDYMVNESLKQYIVTKTGIDEAKADDLLNEYNDDVALTSDDAKSIKKAIDDIKIIDPACGSGAFPMGVLHKLLSVKSRLDILIQNTALEEAKKSCSQSLPIKKGQKISYSPDGVLSITCVYKGNYLFEYTIGENGTTKQEGTLKVNDLTLAVKTYINHYNSRMGKKTIANLFSQGKIEGKSVSFVTLRSTEHIKRIVDADNPAIIIWEWATYNTAKKEAEENFEDFNYYESADSVENVKYRQKEDSILKSIYGVDIQPIAVEISKLRTFLSLIIDEKVIDDVPNRNIKALPNLEFKFVAANSLVALPKSNETLFSKNENVVKLEKLREEYFSSSGERKKDIIREYHNVQDKLFDSVKDFRGEHYRETLLADWSPFEDKAAEWFDAEFMFGVKDGFDVVIGNPPYGAKYPEEQKKYYKENYISAQTKNGLKGSLDTFSLFIEKGYDLTALNGVLSYIVPMAVTSSDSMTSLHDLLLKNCEKIKISSYFDRPKKIFDNAEQSVSIIELFKSNTRNKILLTTKVNKRYYNKSINEVIQELNFVNSASYIKYGRFPKVGSEIELDILNKIFTNKTNISHLKSQRGGQVFYRTTGGRYYKIITTFSTGSTKENNIIIKDNNEKIIAACLTSNLFFWFYHIYSNNLDLKSYELEIFPVPIEKLLENKTEIESLYAEYLDDLMKNSKIKQANYSNISEYREFYARKSKYIIDKIDKAIQSAYGLTDEEINFIINYDIKFRTDDEE